MHDAGTRPPGARYSGLSFRRPCLVGERGPGAGSPAPAPPAGPPAGPREPRRVRDDVTSTGLRLLAAGRLFDVADHVRASGRQDLVADLLLADAEVRTHTIEVPALQELVDRVLATEPPGSERRAWAYALLAERMFAGGDLAALDVTRHARDELASPGPTVFPPAGLRYARARLNRVDSAAWLFAPTPEGMARYLALRDQCTADLLSCGFMGEVHLTRGWAAGMHANALVEDISENHALLNDARAALGDDPGSLWPSVLDCFLGVSTFEMGDMAGVVEVYDRLERSPYQHPRVRVVHRYGRAFFRLVTAGASPVTVDGIERALSEVRRHDPRVAQAWYGHVTHTLADMGSRAAAHFARLESELPALDEVTRVERRLIGLRVDALAGEPVTAGTALKALEVVIGFGHVRRAARCAVRLAHDLAAGGDPVDAAEVHRWGMDRLPPPGRRTVWETWWARPVAGPVAAPSPVADRAVTVSTVVPPRREPGLSVRVLAPTVEVEVDGRPVTLSDAQAKLLLALVVAHPTPLHVEQASDVLWPDDPLAVTRSRLNSLVHRLRRVLHPHGDALSRVGALLRLDGARCSVDLWWFQQALAGDADDRRRALVSVRGNLGDAQFPYDEGFVYERHRVSGEWVRHACRAQRGGEIAIAELEPALTSLKLTSADIDVMSG